MALNEVLVVRIKEKNKNTVWGKMMKSFFKIVSVVSLFVIPLMAGSATQVSASGPNPPSDVQERIIGPATEGVIYMEFVDDFQKCCDNGSCNEFVQTCYIATVVGACQKQPIVLRYSEIISLADFEMIPEEYMLDFRVDGISPPGCYSELGGEDLIITGVSKFNNTSTDFPFEIYAIGARVNISAVELK